MFPLLKRNAFPLGLLGAVLLAVMAPGPGTQGGFLRPESTTLLGVWLLFFLQGLFLPCREVASGYRPKRVQAFVLGWNYLFFPAVVGIMLWLAGGWLSEEVRTGFLLCAILPTTVASAVLFSSLSGGATPNAIFAAVLSNLSALLVVPLLAWLFLSGAAAPPLPPLSLPGRLVLLILLPLLLGQFLQWRKPRWSSGVAPFLQPAGNGIILFLVYTAFAESVESGFLTALTVAELGGVFLTTAAVLLLVSGLVWWSAGRVGLTASQRVAAFFCASQKSLATGLPLLTSILAVLPGALAPAAVFLPLILYHLAQLLLAGWLVPRLYAFAHGNKVSGTDGNCGPAG